MKVLLVCAALIAAPWSGLRIIVDTTCRRQVPYVQLCGFIVLLVLSLHFLFRSFLLYLKWAADTF